MAGKKQRLELGTVTLVGRGGSMVLPNVSREDYDRIEQAMGAEPITVLAFTIHSGIFGTRATPRPVRVNTNTYHTLKAFEPHGTYTVRLP